MSRAYPWRHAVTIGTTLAAFTLPAWVGCRSPQAPEAPAGGGDRYVFDYQRFVGEVAPALARRGCDAGGDCHGGGIRGTFALSPREARDPGFDYEQCVQQVYGGEPAASPLLRKPLSRDAGGAAHSYEPFASTEDPDYQVILRWIEAGEVE